LVAAAKLYQHAMALAPRNAEVLNSFGEFLEESRQDLLQADHFFARAIGRIIDTGIYYKR
jgi:Tfp pilus assembly protein PilF